MPLPDPRIHPTRIKAPRNARVLGITWADGHVGVYPHEILRGYCPCAGCQGHSGTIRFVPGGELDLVELAGCSVSQVESKSGLGGDLFKLNRVRRGGAPHVT